MKYYSEKTKDMYDTETELKKAETEFDKAETEKAELAKTKEIRQKGVEKAFEDAYNLLDEFIKDYGSFSGEISVPFDIDTMPRIRRSFFDRFFGW